jgi:hypothetical protein
MTFRYPSAGHFTFDASGTGDVDRFRYGDPVNSDYALPQTSGTARRWNWDNNDTTSTNVGPTSGEGGSPDGYLHPEASSPTANNDEFYLELEDSGSPGNPQTYDASANDITVEFSTNQRGDNNDATCVVETNENAAGWVERGTVFGGTGDSDKVATGGTQIWSQRSVDLTGLISHASTRIRLKVITTTTGNVWHCDYGIDRVAFIGVTAVTRTQEGYRWRNDDGSESAATWKENQDTAGTAGTGDTVRLRGLTDYSGGATEAVTLESKKSTDADTFYRKVKPG